MRFLETFLRIEHSTTEKFVFFETSKLEFSVLEFLHMLRSIRFAQNLVLVLNRPQPTLRITINFSNRRLAQLVQSSLSLTIIWIHRCFTI